MFTTDEMIKAVIENIGPCTISEIQQIFNIPTDVIRKYIDDNSLYSQVRNCNVTNEIANAYSFVDALDITALYSRVKELENKLAEKKKFILRINKRKRIRFIDKIKDIPPVPEPEIIETENPDEAFQQALAELNNRN